MRYWIWTSHGDGRGHDGRGVRHETWTLEGCGLLHGPEMTAYFSVWNVGPLYALRVGDTDRASDASFGNEMESGGPGGRGRPTAEGQHPPRRSGTDRVRQGADRPKRHERFLFDP